VGVGDDIAQQRIKTVRQFPKAHYERIYEPGCGGATTFRALNTVFPDAELVGSDLSAELLKGGHRMAESQGLKAHLKQREITRTGEPDTSFDGVITYALHHELPPKENAKLFEEMYRILKPGGDIVISDPPPFRVVDLFHAVVLDWETENRGEPFFSAVLHSSLEQQLKDAGFTNVEGYALGQDWYPWITRGTKPVDQQIGKAT
jgi:SAM-dependent methyltransferase